MGLLHNAITLHAKVIHASIIIDEPAKQGDGPLQVDQQCVERVPFPKTTPEIKSGRLSETWHTPLTKSESTVRVRLAHSFPRKPEPDRTDGQGR